MLPSHIEFFVTWLWVGAADFAHTGQTADDVIKAACGCPMGAGRSTFDARR